MRLALWTAEPGRWPGLPSAGEDSITLVSEPAAVRPAADLDIYHLRDDPAFAFVLRSLEARPGIVVLEDQSLHTLVHAETAGRGDLAGYLRAARRAAGPRGAFVARQVLRGLGGALVPLLALDDTVLDGALALIVADAGQQARLARRVRGRPLLVLSLVENGPATLAAAALVLARELRPGLAARVAALEALRDSEATSHGRALAELRPLARELGLPDLPENAGRALASLFASPVPPAGPSGR